MATARISSRVVPIEEKATFERKYREFLAKLKCPSTTQDVAEIHQSWRDSQYIRDRFCGSRIEVCEKKPSELFADIVDNIREHSLFELTLQFEWAVKDSVVENDLAKNVFEGIVFDTWENNDRLRDWYYGISTDGEVIATEVAVEFYTFMENYGYHEICKDMKTNNDKLAAKLHSASHPPADDKKIYSQPRAGVLPLFKGMKKSEETEDTEETGLIQQLRVLTCCW